MHFSLPQLPQIIQWLSVYGYIVLLPLAVIEGPIVSVLAGLLASLGQMNLFLALLVIVFGDLIGDSILYYLGRYSLRNGTPKWVKYLGVTPERVEKISHYFVKYPNRIFLIGKAAHGIGAAALYAAGAIKYPYRKFILYNIFPTVIKSVVLILIGYYFGRAYTNIKSYLDYVALAVLIICVIGYFAFKKYSAKFFEDENLTSK